MSLAEIYTEMRQKHPIIIQEEFKLETYGMKAYSETYKKAYPDKFKRHFFHLIKTLNGKPAGKMTAKQVNKNARRLPTTFMVAGTSKRCTIHEFSCPSEPCPYRTHNKKIVMTASLARKEVQATVETRSRVFYREDKKKDMPAIFMTNEDQLNCRFEPLAGRLNPQFWGIGSKPSEELMKTAVTEKEFQEKHGPNMKNSHVEVYKKGVLKRAQGFFTKGEYKMALSALMSAFKLRSLRNMFEPNFHEKQKKREEKKEKLKAANAMRKRDDDFQIEAMQEDPDEIQSKMPNEDQENIKLQSTLKEAYDLLAKIEKIETDAEKAIAKLEKDKRKLKEKKNHLSTMTTIEDQAANTKDLFKTIMCPLVRSCPNHTKDRWPKSNAKSIQ